MSTQLGRFTDAEAESRFHALYDTAMALLPPPAGTDDVPTAFGTVRVYRFGTATGPPLVLLPGRGGTTALWLPNLAAWTLRRTVYAVEPLGDAGPSRQDRPIRTADDQASWLGELLGTLDTGPAHLVGQSVGAWLATQVALRAPERAASLSLIEPTQVLGRIRPGLVVAGLLTIPGLPEPLRRRALRWIVGTGDELFDGPIGRLTVAAAGGFRNVTPPPALPSDEQLRGLRVPVLALLGGRSRTHDARRSARRARELLPDLRVAIVDGAGHALNGEFPDVVNERVLDFTDAIDRTAPGPG
ncbi:MULTISPECIES: alpha/beta fold hydrolase [Pseudonocardia]|nr:MULTISPECIES: alpha/beta hydrolase [Pseudonocardia]